MSSVNKYLTKAKINPHAKDKYERLGLRDNPFPFDPVLDPDSENVRINGAIYCESIKEKEISLFKEHFFQQELNGNHRRLGYLIDSSYTGRGNGKSALLVHLQKQTDADFGFEMTGGQNKIFSLYVKPEPSGKTVKFWQLSYLLIDRLTKMSVLSDCIISLSYDYALSVLGEEELGKYLVVEDDFKKLLDYKFLGEIGIGDFEMKSHIDRLLSSKGVDKSIINALLRTRFEPEAGLSLFVNSKNESLQKKEMSWIFFDQLVRVFVASGFNGCCIFFDEFEKMVEPQKLSERNDFAAELRHNLLDGGSLGTVLGFYMMVLAMHPGVPNIITESWEKSGVNVRCPLPSQAQGIEQQHTVFFNNLQKENVREMIGEYLNYFRVAGYAGDKLFPFTAESIDYIAEAASFNAAKSLKIAYNLIDKVSNSDNQLVDENFIRRMAEENQQASSVDNGSLDFLEKKSPSPLKGIIFNQIK